MNQAELHKKPENLPEFRRMYVVDRQAVLAALRVVLGLPRVIPNSGDDLLSNAS